MITTHTTTPSNAMIAPCVRCWGRGCGSGRFAIEPCCGLLVMSNRTCCCHIDVTPSMLDGFLRQNESAVCACSGEMGRTFEQRAGVIM